MDTIVKDHSSIMHQCNMTSNNCKSLNKEQCISLIIDYYKKNNKWPSGTESGISPHYRRVYKYSNLKLAQPPFILDFKDDFINVIDIYDESIKSSISNASLYENDYNLINSYVENDKNYTVDISYNSKNKFYENYFKI